MIPPNWPPLPSEEELERSFTQWEREQEEPPDLGPHPERPSVEFTQRYYPQALPSEWEEMQ